MAVSLDGDHAQADAVPRSRAGSIDRPGSVGGWCVREGHKQRQARPDVRAGAARGGARERGAGPAPPPAAPVRGPTPIAVRTGPALVVRREPDLPATGGTPTLTGDALADAADQVRRALAPTRNADALASAIEQA